MACTSSSSSSSRRGGNIKRASTATLLKQRNLYIFETSNNSSSFRQYPQHSPAKVWSRTGYSSDKVTAQLSRLCPIFTPAP
jgi:hypothetical protein